MNQDTGVLSGTALWSKMNFAVLDGGGYIQEFPESKGEAAALMADLKAGDWYVSLYKWCYPQPTVYWTLVFSL